MKSIIERFEEKFITDPNCGCWLWIAGLSSTQAKPNNTYGIFSINCRPIKSHRASWILYKGDNIGDKHVLHKCDNPLCVNPEHLFLGTHKENMADMKAKGRAVGLKGEAHNKAKVTISQVEEIRALKKKGWFLRQIAEVYPIKKSMISYICRRENWNV